MSPRKWLWPLPSCCVDYNGAWGTADPTRWRKRCLWPVAPPLFPHTLVRWVTGSGFEKRTLKYLRKDFHSETVFTVGKFPLIQIHFYIYFYSHFNFIFFWPHVTHRASGRMLRAFIGNNPSHCLVNSYLPPEKFFSLCHHTRRTKSTFNFI